MERPTLDPDRLRAALAPRWPVLDVVAETESTNADLLARATGPEPAPDRSLLVAEHQTAGRGRLDRSWTSPPRAGLTVSMLLRPGVPLARWGWLPLLTGVAVAEAVADVAGVIAALKWPNDVLLDGRKLAGILAQSAEDAAVVGIGANVSTAAAELPVEAATSLAIAGVDVDRTDLLVALAGRVDARAAQWSDHGGDAGACGLAAAYRERCDTLGRQVRVTLGDGTAVTGEVAEVDDNGHLVLLADGAERVITAGDVEHLRATG